MGNLYYLSDNNMSSPGVGAEGQTNIDSFDSESTDFAFISNCTPEEVYHFSSKSEAEKVIKNLPFPYNERCKLMEISDLKHPLYKRIFYKIGKICLPFEVSWCNEDGIFTSEIPFGEKTSFVDKSEAEEFLSKIENAPIGASVFEFYDFGPPNYYFWYKSNSGAIYTPEGEVCSLRTDVDIKKCAFGDLGIPVYVYYCFLKKTPSGSITWMDTDNTFNEGTSDKTLYLYTLDDAKKYVEVNSLASDVEIVEIYSSGSPDWEWNYKVLSSGKVYTSSSKQIV